MKNNDPPTKRSVSVSEMARMLGLSRARFYQLMSEGVFPQPERNPQTNRPYFDQEQQKLCLLVRQTNQGANGRTVLFYGRRLDRSSMPQRPPARRYPSTRARKKQAARRQADHTIDELRHGLKQLGLTEITAAQIRQALSEAYPDGHQQVGTAELLSSVFRHLKCQNPPDNVT